MINKINDCNIRNVKDLVTVTGEFIVQVADEIQFDTSGDIILTISDSTYMVDCKMDKVYKSFIENGRIKKTSFLKVKSLILDFSSKVFRLQKVKLLDQNVNSVIGCPMPFNWLNLCDLNRRR